MKALLSLRLSAALLVAAPLFAADAPKPTPPAKGKSAEVKPPETAEQKTTRHAREAKDTEAKINALLKDHPLLTGPGWEENYGKFRAELARVQRSPEFKGKVPQLSPPAPGKGPPAPKSPAQVQQERREAEFGLMRQQADKVLATHPELRAYVEQQFQWHRRLFDLQDEHPDNPKVRQLVQNRLEVVVVPVRPTPGAAK